jgi:hypothetical protein
MVTPIYDIIKIDIGGKVMDQGKSKKQIEDNYWMLEKAFKCFLASLIFYLIFSLIN